MNEPTDYRVATLSEALEVLYSRHSDKFSPAESRELRQAIEKLAALKEYGEHVRAEAVKVCKGEADATHYYFSQVREGITDCAAAIEKMELP